MRVYFCLYRTNKFSVKTHHPDQKCLYHPKPLERDVFVVWHPFIS